MARLLIRLMDLQSAWVRPLGDFNHRWISALFRPIRPIKDLLNGTWLGHPLHAATTDIPIGALLVSVALDLLGQPTAADVALVATVVFMLLAAVSGAADYADTDGRARERATLHATIMVVSLVVLLVSLGLRATAPADRTLPIVLSIVGLLGVTAGAFVGGDVVYAFGNMVSRHAFRGAGTKWIAVDLPEGGFPEGQLVKAKMGINNLVLIRDGERIVALHDQCAHAGGPLSEGTVVGDAIECPWHGSRFRLSDGHLRRGPAVYDQPAYEVRRTDVGGWEGRRVG
jgi:nitrite reductase/ring-hydroxylating ferredoxin subunit